MDGRGGDVADKDEIKKFLMAKARGFTISIEKMGEKVRETNAPGNYGEDYNKLRELTEKTFPDLGQFLPPPVAFYRISNNTDYTQQKYIEIDTFCEQIYQILGGVE